MMFAYILYGFAAVALVATGAYPNDVRESLVAALVFGLTGAVIHLASYIASKRAK